MADDIGLGEKEDRLDKAGCPVFMDWRDTLRCGEPLHAAPEGVDPIAVCLMHSKDEEKFKGRPLFESFLERFEAILHGAGSGRANFRRFVFPELALRGKTLQPECQFENTTFSQNADFTEVTFAQGANFAAATFAHTASFWGTIFLGDAYFFGVTVKEEAEFVSTTFKQRVVFDRATFAQDATFQDSKFELLSQFKLVTFAQEARFNEAMFSGVAVFRGATFTGDVSFDTSTFCEHADFYYTTFMEDADFSNAIFTKSSDFNLATFTGHAEFWLVEFMLKVDLTETRFRAGSSWRRCHFRDGVVVRRSQFTPDEPRLPGAVFALSSFGKPGEVVFDDVDLSRVLFHNCDVSQLWFTSSVRWGTEPGRRAVILEERIGGEEAKEAGLLLEDGRKNLGAIAQIYQQLKRNYDSRLDYWTANEFHFGEMEMQRLDVPREGRLLGARQWWHRTLSLVALYRWGSSYGNSFRLPLAWIAATLLVFTLMFPLAGLELKSPSTGPVGQSSAKTVIDQYWTVWACRQGVGRNVWQEVVLLGHSFLTTVDTATFQRNLEYTPHYPWGRAMAIVETLLTSTLAGLFFLALRRQFRR